MACLNIETVTYPSWWASATTVQVTYAEGGNSGQIGRANVELLPQGVSLTAAGVLVPWHNVVDIQQIT